MSQGTFTAGGEVSSRHRFPVRLDWVLSNKKICCNIICCKDTGKDTDNMLRYKICCKDTDIDAGKETSSAVSVY